MSNPYNNYTDRSNDGSTLSFFRRRRPSWWHNSYIIDWVLLLVSLIILIIMETAIPPWSGRSFNPSDPALSFPLQSSIFPTWSLILIAFVTPIIVITIMQIWVKSGHDFHHAILSLLEAFLINGLITNTFKLLVGRYRPDWIERCDPNDSGICQSSNTSEIADGRKSFPSGHSSVSFCGMTFLSLYLAGKLHLMSRHGGEFWKAVIVGIPEMIAGFVAVSRTMDYHHHFSDIIAGTLIGISCSVVFYLMNYTHEPGSDDVLCIGSPKYRRPVAWEKKTPPISFDHEVLDDQGENEV
eukprot:gb/GECH01003033.1/.p1 GENE.gb/GECH01003033.1/~~gb/GECH01003033.1/.p1  ORF type:complete len:296 (+),score=37.66 gb/GECH01003033.1/:1-888(+)